MAEGEFWLFRPVAEGVLRAESIFEGSVDLEYIATLNDMLDVKAENEARWRKANP